MTVEFEATEPRGSRRLWTPWRMNYVGGESKETGCIFCNRVASEDDVASMILHRSNHCFVIMNLFPYNTGHVMIVPNQHIASPEDADPESLGEMAQLLPVVLRSLRRVLKCQGFNVGLNIGSIAGAGIAEHLHQHIVPRWNGDANFMPIIGGAMVIPELIPSSYAKIRAELTRDLNLARNPQVTVVVLDPGNDRVLIDSSGLFPSIPLNDTDSVWKTASDFLADRGIRTGVAGWAGEKFAGVSGELALTFLVEAERGDRTLQWHDLQDHETMTEPAHALLQRALSQLSPLLTATHDEQRDRQ